MNDLNIAQRELDALIITRDWYIADIHTAPLPVALWRTFTHRRPLTSLTRRIEAQRDIVDYLEMMTAAPIPYTLSPAALPLITDSLFDLVDALGNSPLNVRGEIDGRTVDTVDGVIVVSCDGVEQYRAVCGDEPFEAGNITDLAVDLEGRLHIDALTLVCTGGRATIGEGVDALTPAARAVLDLLCARDLLLSGEVDGAVVTSEQLESTVRVTARVSGAVVYQEESDAALDLDAPALCEAVQGAAAYLHGHSLKDRHSDVRVISGDGAALVTVNNWQAARI